MASNALEGLSIIVQEIFSSLLKDPTSFAPPPPPFLSSTSTVLPGLLYLLPQFSPCLPFTLFFLVFRFTASLAIDLSLSTPSRHCFERPPLMKI
jgi:hypothetical protein